MADMYGNPYEPRSLPGQLQSFPRSLSAPWNQYNAQYYGMPCLQGEFRYSQHSHEPSSQSSPSPQDPYSMNYGYHKYHQERCIGNIGPVYYPKTTHIHQLGGRDPVTCVGKTLPSYSQGQVQGTLPQNDRLPDRRIEDIQKTARSFVEMCCPLLGMRPYCLPPIKRYRHPDKSNKKLVQLMEGEKRVLGSFERYFVEKNVPVFMLCYYPLSGFLQVYKSKHLLEKTVMTVPGQSSKNTVMLLLSTTFGITVLSISSIGGNAQFDHLRRRVLRTITQMNEISSTVASWLKLLGVRSEVRQVIAYPNLKRSVMEKVCKDKQVQHSLGSLCTLHVDELAPPFEEEYSDTIQKQLFHLWMLQNVLCHDSTLSQADLQLVVGALLSPKLSKVDFVQGEKMIMPIPETIQYTDTVESKSTGVGQLKLTIDGVTRPFDEFMDQYITCYYPNVEGRTYRVPPIHFNIQSLKRSSEYINTFKGEAVLKGLNAGPGDKESKKLEHHAASVHQSRMAGSGENIHSDFQRETSQFKSAQSSAGNNSNPKGQGDLAVSVAQFEPSFSNSLHKSDNCTEEKVLLHDSIDQDSVSSDKHIKALGIYFKESPNSSISLLCNDTPTLSNSRPANVNLQALQDVEILTKVMDKDIRKDEGENRVISALEMLGRHSDLGGQLDDPMFIICGFQYNNYLNKLREEMFPKEETCRPVSAFGQTMRAEHDCLIFHQKYGAIIVCIKAIGDNFDEWHATEDQKIASTKTVLEKALKQLKREEAMIRHVTSDLSVHLKCHKLIALPNMSRASVKAALWTDLQLKKTIRDTLGHEADLFLCSDELPPKHTFLWDGIGADVKHRLITWWKRVKVFFESSGDNRIEIPEYKQLIGRYCGLFSTIEVWSPTNPRMEVRSSSEAVKTCADRFCKFVLLPCQLKAVCSNERQVYLYGPPGSGKTLVLTLKAKQWMLAGRTVVLVNSRSGSNMGYPYAYGLYNRLLQMMMESKIPLRQLYMINIDSLNFHIDELKSIQQSNCVIMDEVTSSSCDIIISLCYQQISSIWCAGLFVEDIPKTYPAFSTYKMEKILRCPPAVQSILKHTEEAVRLNKPYEKVYQSSITEQEHCFVLNNDQFNKYIDKILKSHVAYFSQLQKGKKRYVKSVTSKLSLVQLVRWAKRSFDDIYSHKPGQNKPYKRVKPMTRSLDSDNIRIPHFLYCSEPQKTCIQYGKPLSELASLNYPTDARRAYEQMVMQTFCDRDTAGENKISSSVCLDGKFENVEVIDESGQRSMQQEPMDISKEILPENHSLHDKRDVGQLTQSVSAYQSNTEHQDVESETSMLSYLAIKSISENGMNRFHIELQNVEAPSDTNTQHSAAGHLIELCLASSSTQLADNNRDNEELIYYQESLSERLMQKYDQESLSERIMQKYDQESLSEIIMQKYGQRCNLTTVSHSRNDSAQLVTAHHEVKCMLDGDQKYDQESLQKRLVEKYGQRCHLTTFSPSKNTTAQLVTAHHEVKCMLDGDQKYDQESLQKRLVEKYGQRCHLTTFSSSKNTTAQLVTAHHEIKLILGGDQKYDQESLQKRLDEKYGQRCHLTTFSPSKNTTAQLVTAHHEIKLILGGDQKYDQESLQKRLEEKYGSGLHIKSEKCSMSYNRKPVCNTVYKIKSDSELLNKRLKEKYNGHFINKLLDVYQQETIDKLKRTTYKGNVDEEDSQENRKIDSDMVNSRLQKYARKPQLTPKLELTFDEFRDCSSHTVITLPSDGPQPKIIDHSLHFKTGKPIDCKECAHELAEFLNTMIRPDNKSVFPKGNHNFNETKNSGRGSPESSNILLSNASSVYKKLPKSSFLNKYGVFENRALGWSDVVIVSREMPKASNFVEVLRNKNIPVEVCLGEKARRIEDSKEKKLFVTSCKEITGIERPVIVFLPSDKRDDSQQPPDKVKNIDLKLANCIKHFSEDDKVALWYAASRSLAFLVLILP